MFHHVHKAQIARGGYLREGVGGTRGQGAGGAGYDCGPALTPGPARTQSVPQPR